jgi:AbrB family looped-hinge helix DNA binding protein
MATHSDIVESMASLTLMKVTQGGQISIPAEVRRRWNTDRVVVIDTPDGLIVRPFDPNAADRIMGKYHRPGAMTSDEMRRIARDEDAEREARFDRP